MSDPREMELRHAELLGQLPDVEIPAELHRPEFLEGIYERIADDFAESLDEEVAASLSEPVAPPIELDSPVLENEALRNIEHAKAPGMLDARLRADIRAFGARRRRVRTWRRASTLVAAAAVLVVSISLLTRGSRDQAPVTQSDEDFVIVRHRMSAPFAPGYSVSGVMHEISTAGGNRAK